MNLKKHKRIDLAKDQFESAVRLFLTNGDKFSVITLAGAADVIFCQILKRNNVENFTQFVIKEEADSRTIQVVGKEINDLFCINSLKHLDKGEPETLEMNLEDCAVGAILKALPNYNLLEERNGALMNLFLKWIKENLDPKIYNVDLDTNWGKSK